jgi:UDP-N-acetylglucosamine 1-carboxyvinyltransferase
MTSYIIKGGTKLSGHIDVTGNKNSILPLMAASLLIKGRTTLENVPRISDVEVMREILSLLGVKSDFKATHTLVIDSTARKYAAIPIELTGKLRASILLLGPMLAVFGDAEMGFPGGDVIGKRAISTHLDGLAKLGTTFALTSEKIVASLKKNTEKKQRIFLDESSVTGTENILLLAALLPNEVIIENAACEPHVVDLCEFLSKIGAKISGEGTNHLTITGITSPKETVFQKVGADYVDAATFAIAAAITHSRVTIGPIKPNEMEMILLYLSRFGVKYRWKMEEVLEILPSDLVVNTEGIGTRQKFQTRPWPGFSPDLMSPLIVLATQASGTALLHDWMYETRFFFTDKLVAMGANITICDPHRVLVTGPTKLHGRHLNSPDIRAGMSFVLAGMVASETTVVDHAELIERGYEDPVGRLKALGAEVSVNNG